MRDHLNNIFEEILEEVNNFDDDRPDWLFEILVWSLTDAEKAIEEEYLPKIHKAVKENKSFAKDYVIDYYKGLPNFYMLGIKV